MKKIFWGITTFILIFIFSICLYAQTPVTIINPIRLAPGATVAVYVINQSTGISQNVNITHTDVILPVELLNQIAISNSSFTVLSQQYVNRISSGTSGYITGIASYTITVTDIVTDFNFGVTDATTSFFTIEPSYKGSRIPFNQGLPVKTEVRIPQAITFIIRGLNLTSQLIWDIDTLK